MNTQTKSEPSRIYVFMHESWWSYSIKEWKELVATIIDSGESIYDGFLLDDKNLIRNKPKTVYRERDSSYVMPLSSSVAVVTPLQWEYSDFVSHAASSYRN